MPLITSTTIAHDIRSKVLSSTGLTDGGTVRSVGCKVARLVLGEADVYLSHHPVKYWDSCGPLVILLEAGGRWSDLEGRPYRLEVSRGLTRHPTPFVASNGCIHDMLCAEMRLLL